MPVTVINRHPSITNRLQADIDHTALTLTHLLAVQQKRVNVVLTDDAEIQILNRDYRNRDKPTNVLSFPLHIGDDPGSGILALAELGDIVISVDTAAAEAVDSQQLLLDRLISLLVHGMLHLLGFDHERSAQEANDMLSKERDLINQLRKFRRRGMTHLAINVDHVATIRQARGIDEPDPVAAAAICELAGAEGIVVHLREDRRHIQDRDVRLLRETVKTKLNLEMGAAKKIIKIALEIKPDMVTLVPEKRQELTTEGGLDVRSQKKKLADTIATMTKADIPVSLFIDPDPRQIKAAAEIGSTFVEIHTGRYADATSEEQQQAEFELIKTSAYEAQRHGLRVNAGHGLNYFNTAAIAAIGPIEELSIGHAVISRAVFSGLEQAVRDLKALIDNARGSC